MRQVRARRDRGIAQADALPLSTVRNPIDWWLTAIDPVAAVRGMSSGFSVLVIGGLAAPIVARVPLLGSFALVLTSLVGFIVAARRPGRSRVPLVQGATAAVGAYLLVVPLVLAATHRWNPVQVAVTATSALLVGAVVGLLAGRFVAVGTRS